MSKISQTKKNLTTHRVDLPASAEAIAAFRPGDVVYLNGVVYTAREGIYQRILGDGVDLPVDDLAAISNANFHCSPAARSSTGKSTPSPSMR